MSPVFGTEKVSHSADPNQWHCSATRQVQVIAFCEFFVENIFFLLNEMLFRAAPYTGTSDLI